ncbi:MAG: hypothetical protein US69_C0006G0020 [candidate division TM6 bacterium GW2011_GWF2_38_10]|nr:MAG: hypothetical protein US69_C0006G0020 [candidate division TM6 bacterium GW2011_GWF2_38_10]
MTPYDDDCHSRLWPKGLLTENPSLKINLNLTSDSYNYTTGPVVYLDGGVT